MAERRRCQKCGREYAPKNGNQRFCSAFCRENWRAARASGRAPCGDRICAGCGRTYPAQNMQQRFCSSRCRERTRVRMPTAKYGHRHQQLRKRLAPALAAGGVRCARCGEPILPGEPWDLGHVDGSATRYSGPEHAYRCNRRAGAEQTNAKAADARRKRKVSRDW
jgi:predicted nucleic acid-binding Zn ribbon protein